MMRPLGGQLCAGASPTPRTSWAMQTELDEEKKISELSGKEQESERDGYVKSCDSEKMGVFQNTLHEIPKEV